MVKYLVIGGGPAGISAALRIRSGQAPEDDKVLIVEKGPSLPYMRLDLSKGFMWGEIPKEKMFFGTLEQLSQMGIEIALNEAAVSLDAKGRTLTTDKREIEFEKALLATGSSPRKIPLPGSELANVFYLRSLEDAELIRSALEDVKSRRRRDADRKRSRRVEDPERSRRAVLIGGGLISFELSYAFHRLGVKSTILIRDSYLWEGKVEEDLGKMLQKTLEENGVEILAKTEVAEILGRDEVEEIRLKDGKEIPADLAVIGVGVIPNIGFLEGSGIETGKGIICDQFLQTNIEGIFAAGDIAEFYDVVLGKRHMIGHWNNALWQGQLAGENLIASSRGEEFKEYRRVTSYDTKVFDLSLSFLGDPEGHDQREVEGDIANKKAKLVYHRDRKPIGAILINWESKKEVEDLILEG